MTDLHDLSQADGAGDWREKEARDLSTLVQNRISFLQVQNDASVFLKYRGFFYCNIKAEYSASLLQSSVSHDPPEIILIY